MKKKRALIFLVIVIFSAILLMLLPRILVWGSTRNYIEDMYSDTDYIVEDVFYDFKTGYYYADIISPSSIDGGFTVCTSVSGKICYDTYESAVENKWNTANRINDEYRRAADAVLYAEDFPYKHHIAFGEIVFSYSDAPADEAIPEYAVDSASLVPDADYDVMRLGREAGLLTVYIYDETVSFDRMAELLSGIRRIADEKGISFYAITCVLEKPMDENASAPSEERIDVINFLYDDIYDEALSERVRIADESAKAYFSAQNDVKENEKSTE